MSRPATTLRRLVQVCVAGLVLAATGCGVGKPAPIDPQGVDGLVIPTPRPDPADFVGQVDNPWFPLPADGEWDYETTDGRTITVTVTGRTRTIEGVAATEVATTVKDGREATILDFYAQDDAGNVWALGGDGWQAGTDGAEAGLVMAATPRVGDGYVEQSAPGVAESTAEVLDLEATASAPAGSWRDLVEIAGTSTPTPGASSLRYFAPGIGLVRSESSDAVTSLVSTTLD